jgi:hypothetical protein
MNPTPERNPITAITETAPLSPNCPYIATAEPFGCVLNVPRWAPWCRLRYQAECPASKGTSSRRLSAVLLVWPRPVAGLLGAGFMASTLAGLIVSINFGLFGFRESSKASFVVETIILESVGAVALLAWTAAAWQGLTRSRFSRR